MFRNEKPGPGRFRQFTQFDADTVGAESVAADAEMCMLAADTMEALGFERGQYVIKVNNRKVLDGIMETVGIDLADTSTKLAVLRSLDKLDKFDAKDVRLLLGPGRKDESGDFTKGAGLDAKQILELCVECIHRQHRGEPCDPVTRVTAVFETERRSEPEAAEPVGTSAG